MEPPHHSTPVSRGEPLAARARIIDARSRYQRGEATLEDLYAAADAYIAAIRAYGKATGQRLPVPGRSYTIRAL